jgi:hypothetical protein
MLRMSRHRSAYSSPATRADMGTSECEVMPGEVLISNKKGWRSVARIMTSARAQPRQPSVR